LSHKHLEENPWDAFEGTFDVGTQHECTIISKTDKMVALELPYGIEGAASLKSLGKKDDSLAEVGDKLTFIVTEFNKDEKKIILSHSKTWDGSAVEAAEKNKKKSGGAKVAKTTTQAVEKSTLGDLSALAALKEEMEAPKKKAAPKKKKEDAE
jgi:small subunit ribosomal protein S1